MKNTDRIILNTVAQYVKIVVVVVVMLYSTKIVLKELGGADYGLYSLVGSVLAFLSFMNTAMTRSTQRFLSISMGKNDVTEEKKVFFNSVILNALLALTTLLFAGILYPFIFSGALDIPIDKFTDAKWLYVCMCFSVVFTINISPFNALFIAHENIVFSSAIYVLWAFLKLFAAMSLPLWGDLRLVGYGLMMAIISAIEFFVFFIVSYCKYEDCKGAWNWAHLDNKTLRSIISFTGWNMYGTACVISRTQGFAIVINRFFSLAGNAAYGIATQVSGQISNLVYSLSNAISPVLMKSEGSGKRDSMVNYAIMASKYSFLLFMLIAVPALFEMNSILELWLNNVPQYTTIFVLAMIVANICDSLSVGFRTGIQAVGKIKNFTLVTYTMKLLSIPVSVIILLSNADEKLVFIPYVATELIGTYITLHYFSQMTATSSFDIMKRLMQSLFPCLLTALLTSLCIAYSFPPSVFRLLMNIVITMVLMTICAYLTALSNQEKSLLRQLGFRLLHKL